MNAQVGQLLLRHDTRVTCPRCATEFSLEEGFAKKALDALSEASAGDIAALRQAERATVENLAEQRAAEKTRAAQSESESLKKLLKEQAETNATSLAQVRELAEKSLAPKLAEMQRNLAVRDGELEVLRAREDTLTAREKELDARVAAAARAQASELMAADRREFEERLAGKDSQLAVLRGEQLTLRLERARLQDEKAALALEVQMQVDARLQQREASVRAQEQEKAQLEKAELQKKLDDAGEQLAAAQRRMEQGSQQLQGEVLELAIEENLRRAFPLDTIEEVKKGQRGGDVLQHVVTRMGHTAGTILWETKRARDWSAQWTVKLKEDMRACNAAVGILVTTPGAVPKEWPGSADFALIEDVWITKSSCAVGVAEILRAGLLDVHRQRLISAGKGEKADAMYDYVTSLQFAAKLKAVFDTFKKLREELESEKNVTLQRWARREKQLETGKAQLLGIGGEIQGLAQTALPTLDLESPSLEHLET